MSSNDTPHQGSPSASSNDHLSSNRDFTSRSASPFDLNQGPFPRRIATARRSKRESDPSWLERNERAILPQGCLPSEDFWMLQDSDKEWYRSEVDNLLGYVPTPYLKPRARDLPGLRLRRAERDNGIFHDPPELILPSVISGEIFRANKEDVRKGIKYGKNDMSANSCLLYTSPSPRDRG